MNFRYVVDSSVWLDYLDGGNEQAKQLIEEEGIATTVLAIAEISDVLKRKGLDPNEPLHFIRSKGIILPLTFNSATIAGQLKNERKKTHPKFGIIDAMHLAITRERKAVFLTRDRDFDGEEDVRII